MRDNFQKLTAADVKIYGVSTQDAASHKAFIAKHGFQFPLVVDDGKVAAAFGVPVTMGFASRQSFLIGPDGKMRAVWRDVQPEGHAAQVLAAVSK